MEPLEERLFSMNDWYHFSVMIILLGEKVMFLFSHVHQEAQGVHSSLCSGVLSGLACCIYLVEVRQTLPWGKSAAWVTRVVRPNHSLGAPLCTDAHHFSVRITNGSNPEGKMAAWRGRHRFDRRELPFVVTFFLEHSGGAMDFRQQILVKAPQKTGWLRTPYGTLLVVWEWHQLPLLTHKVCKGHVGNVESAMKI